MTEKELRKLNRYQLLELLLLQTERVEELEKKITDLEEQLRERESGCAELGSLAEEAMKLSGMFDDAQKAADLYINAARRQAAAILKEANRKAATVLRDAEVRLRYDYVLRQDGGQERERDQ